MKGKLWDLCSQLTLKEIRRIKKAMISPVYNQEASLVKLFEWFIVQQTADHPRMSHQDAFAHACPKKPYDKDSYHAMVSRLLNIIELFLVHENLEHHSFHSLYQLIQVYRKKKISKHFYQNVRKANRLLDQSSFFNAEYHFWQYKIQIEQFEMKGREVRLQQTNLSALTKELNVFLIAEILHWATVIQSHQSVYKSEYEQPFLPMILQEVEKGSWLQIPAIAMYYYSFRALSEPEREDYFVALKKLIQEKGQLFPPNELKEVYTIAINYCVKMINMEKPQYLKEIFDLYQQGLSATIFMNENKFSRWTYTNIVSTGLKLNEKKWTKDFIESYKGFLEKRYRKSVFQYNLARYHYEDDNYDIAMPLLSQTELDDVLMNASAKVLLLKMYFEKKEYEVLHSLLNSFRIYLRRKKFIGYHKRNYEDIIDFTRKMLQLMPYDKKGRAELISKIETAEILTERKWFLVQLGGWV